MRLLFALAAFSASYCDVGVLLEYHHDDRDFRAPPTFFDNDLFLGSRIAFNDTDDSEILIGVLIDTNNAEWSFSLEAETRLSDHFKAELRARAFGNGEPGSPIQQLDQDDYVQLALRYSF